MRVKMLQTYGSFAEGTTYHLPAEMAARFIADGKAIHSEREPSTPNKALRAEQVRKGGLDGH